MKVKAILGKQLVLVAMICSGVAFANSLQWKRGGFGDCSKVCSDAGKRAVSSGQYSRTGQEYWICSANFEGMRPGYNLETSNNCTVGWGNHENDRSAKTCLCH